MSDPAESDPTKRNWRSRFREPNLLRFALALVLAVPAILAAYLVVANIILSKSMLPGWVSGTQNLSMSYGSAYSLIPGRVHLSQLVVRGSDYNIQFELEADAVELDVNLVELAYRRLEGSGVDVSGVSFKLRHNVRSLAGQGDRIAAFPPIEGYEGPPLYQGPPTKSSDKEVSERWVVGLSDVRAKVEQLWITEYRFRGAATATGAFELHPGNQLRLTDTKLVFESGDILVGDHSVASSVDGEVTCEMPTTDIRTADGMQVVDTLSSTVALKLRGGSLDFFGVYLEQSGIDSLRGPFSADVDIRVVEGSIAPGTSVLAESAAASAATPLGEVKGDAFVQVVVPDSADADGMEVRMRSDALGITSNGTASNRVPSARGVEAVVGAAPLDLTQPLGVERRSLKVEQLRVPDLGWVSRQLGSDVQLSGSATAKLDWMGDKGNVEARVVDGSFSHGGFGLSAAGLELSARLERKEEAELLSTKTRLVLDRLRLRHTGDEASVPRLAVNSSSLRFRDEASKFLQGTFDVELSEAQQLLKLALPDVTAPIAKVLAGVDELRARIAVYVGQELAVVELLQADSGEIGARGSWKQSNGSATGRFALETSLGDVGLRVDDSSTSVNVGIKADAFLDEGSNP